LLTKHEEKSINYPPLKNVFDGKYLWFRKYNMKAGDK
jgi:hypothetical protein